ncbi:MAG TPA: MMPL family transporter, partial [Candidatus Thermoplasmatota archaeon]|nr:MMPL family transporter [Candidatus Thermoplasmatota archaeon]
MARIDEKVANGLAQVSIWCSDHAKAVMAIALVLTLVFGYGVTTITTNVDVADVLPRGNPNTDAAQNLTQRFRSTFTQQVTFQVHVDETGARWAQDNAKLTYRGSNAGAAQGLPTGFPDLPDVPLPLPPTPVPVAVAPDHLNITDEVYVRAIEEMVDFIQAHTDFSRSISISNIYALINWTIAGGQGRAPESAFALPGYQSAEEAQRYAMVDQAVKAAVLDTVDAISSPSWNHAATLFMPAADNTLETPKLGKQILKARDEYVEAVCTGKTTFTVFGDCTEGDLAGHHNRPLFTVDLPIANAHSSELVEKDTVRLMPMVAAYILVLLYIAFRNVRAITVSFVTLALGVVWSYGTMGYMGIALNTLNMTIVPLVMGIGIDYSIHMINEFVEHKSEGHTDAEAFRLAGSRSGLAMLIATATTIGGLATLIFSPSLLIAQLGLVATVALTVIYLLAITFIPAALTLVGGSEKMGAQFTRSRLMPAIARGVSQVRYLVVIVLVLVSLLALVGTKNLEKEAFGDPGRNYLPSDPIRQEHEKGLEYFYEAPNSDEKANILAFQGAGILTPQAMDYYRAIEANLKTKDRVIPDTLRTLPFFIETWDTVKGGPTGAVREVVVQRAIASGQTPPVFNDQADSFPDTEAEIRQEVDEMFNSPMRELSAIIVNHPVAIQTPELGMAAMTFSVRAATYDEAEQVWGQVWDAVAEANKTFGGSAPDGISVAFVGNTATNYLFIAEELPWLTYMNVVDNIMLVVLVFVMTRSVKTTFVTLVLSTLTSLWWLALLPFFGIGLAITLVLPMAFIIAIGTDYGIHFMWNIKQTGDAREVFESTGKAVLFSAITTTGAFTFFIAVQNVAVSRTMFATMLAFVVIFVVTLLTIPAFFKVEGAGTNRRSFGQWLLRRPAAPPRRSLDQKAE